MPATFRKALILAAGKGSRLGELTRRLPKPMLPIRGKPVLEHHVNRLAAADVREIWINLHHAPDVIRSHFGDGSGFGVRLRYSEEPELLGTSGALRKLAAEFCDGPFFVIYGDNLVELDYAELARQHRGILTMVLHHRDYVAQSGVVQLDSDGRITAFQEKPAPGSELSHLVNAGIYSCEPQILDSLPPGFSDFGTDILPKLLAQGHHLYGIISPVPVIPIDTPEMINEAAPLRAAQIGAGKIGGKRVAASDRGQMIAVADPDLPRAQALATACGAEPFQDWKQAVESERVNLVSVATTNNMLAVIARHALERGKHVLAEKPCALDSAELAPVVELAKKQGLIFQAGFNYRFHPAMQRAKALVESGTIGRLLHGTARHGHGGRLGLEKEWRARPEVSGGGELLDQGVHLIDLVRWLAADEICSVQAVVTTEFWPIQPLEDHAFCLIETAHGAWFSLESSLTQWKNLFYLELVGELGTLIIEGLGGSYGPERLTVIRRPETFGVPTVETEEFADPDACWRAQWQDFILAVRLGREPNGSGADSLAALRVVEACRRSSQEHRRVTIEHGMLLVSNQ